MQKEEIVNRDLAEKYRRVVLEAQNQKEEMESKLGSLECERKDLLALIEKLKERLVHTQEQFEHLDAKLVDTMRQLHSRKDMPDLSAEVDKLRKENYSIVDHNKTLSGDIIRLNKLIFEMNKTVVSLQESNLESKTIIQQKSVSLADAIQNLESMHQDNESLLMEKKVNNSNLDVAR